MVCTPESRWNLSNKVQNKEQNLFVGQYHHQPVCISDERDFRGLAFRPNVQNAVTPDIHNAFEYMIEPFK